VKQSALFLDESALEDIDVDAEEPEADIGGLPWARAEPVVQHGQVKV
jgi:hypothetical protein